MNIIAAVVNSWTSPAIEDKKLAWNAAQSMVRQRFGDVRDSIFNLSAG